ncbi:MAG: hypothetical protein CSA76_01935 [Spirochaetales bacterium]|nr:MAG: hypothetical protein CSA76_01935 [Spirochaetales bacterium]
MVTGADCNRAVEEIKRSGVEHSLHLNLSEGTPLSPAESVPLLVNRNGEFAHSYPVLWLKAVLRKKFREQLKMEMDAQISRYRELFPAIEGMWLDSHQYFHLIPPVWDILMDFFRDGMPISGVRVVNEPLLFLKSDWRYSLRYCFSLNMIKWFWLRLLSFRAVKKLEKLKQTGRSPDYNRAFCGMLYSGNMRRELLTLLARRCTGKPQYTAEVLFHPGGASPDEIDIWKNQPSYGKFYLSPFRRQELEELLKQEAALPPERPER